MQNMTRVSSKGQIVLPAKLREKANWQQILEETAGIWPHIDTKYVDHLRFAAQKRLEGTYSFSITLRKQD
ncbi:hypothetical protein MHOCP_23340 [Moorella humiferrea]